MATWSKTPRQPVARRCKTRFTLFAVFAWGLTLLLVAGGLSGADLQSDTWAAADGLGRLLPAGEGVGPPRTDRTVAMFYFLWHGEHIQGGPHDISKILALDPGAMERRDDPLWGPLHAPHHWGEPLLGYYLSDDEAVLRKHAQQLADAGVDTVVFDVTNQVTYPRWYGALLRVWSAERALGNRTPQIAFLCPFWSPRKVALELWRDLYSPGLHRELWFHWDGKPLLLADPLLVLESEEHVAQDLPATLEAGHTLGQSFTVKRPLHAVSVRLPTWKTGGSGLTLTLRRGPDRVASMRLANVRDNSWVPLVLAEPAPRGDYVLEASAPEGKIGWWSHTKEALPGGSSLRDGAPVPGSRTLRLHFADGAPGDLLERFTFRKPQPDYFEGPTGPDQWSWLEVHPQHVFRNARGEKEQMSVGVAQNAVGGRLGSMSEPGARGRSFHGGATDPRPGAVRLGLNFAEQWERALAEDPRVIFVTGWNEWIAGRFDEFAGVHRPVMFVDQFDEEHSRDIEPQRGGHGDDYYYQLVAQVRRYKGARTAEVVTPRPITIDGRFDDWSGVTPEHLDTVGDPVRRRHRGWDPKVLHEDSSGRNDLVAARGTFDRNSLFFYARTREALNEPTDSEWMRLLIDLDGDLTTGWLGFEATVRRDSPLDERAVLELWDGNAGRWTGTRPVESRVAGNELELALPLEALGSRKLPAEIHFKWTDHCLQSADWSDFTLHGDAAPNDRFTYRMVLSRGDSAGH